MSAGGAGANQEPPGAGGAGANREPPGAGGAGANREPPGAGGAGANQEPAGAGGQITDITAASRFELRTDGQLAELLYRRRGKRLVLIHTGVPDELAGRGIGGQLVAFAAGRAAQEGMTVVPLCPFARRWLARHPEATAQAAIDWGAAGPPTPNQES